MYCKKCGEVITGNTRFCSNCGADNSHPGEDKKTMPAKYVAPVSVENASTPANTPKETVNGQIQNGPTGYIGKVTCPNCGSRNLEASIETDVSVTTTGSDYSFSDGCCGYILFGPLGLLCGLCGADKTTTTNRRDRKMWFCKNCGNKFRDAEDLRIEKENDKKSTKVFLISVAVFIALCVITGVILGFFFSSDMFSSLPSIDPLMENLIDNFMLN